MLLRRTVCSMMDTLRLLLLMTTILQGLLRMPNGADCLKINQLRMPAPLENGSMPAVIVDCDYSYEDNDVTGLVIKWFFNNGPDPIYQWIPPQPPQALGILTTRLDLEYRISEDNYTMHRALRILWPTVELAGNYRCQVSSFTGESEEAKDMVVYVPPSTMAINYTKPTQHTVNVTCMVTGMYPVPEAFIQVYRGQAGEPERIRDGIVSVENNINGDGSYDTVLYREFQDRRLSPDTLFECVFAIPTADYKATDRITYYPGPAATTTTTTTTTRFPSSTPILKDLISTESSLIDIQSITDSGHTRRAWSSSTVGLMAILCLTIPRLLALMS